MWYQCSILPVISCTNPGTVRTFIEFWSYYLIQSCVSLSKHKLSVFDCLFISLCFQRALLCCCFPWPSVGLLWHLTQAHSLYLALFCKFLLFLAYVHIFCFSFSNMKWLKFLFSYVLSFSLGAGPVPALLLPEIFSSRIRAKAVALSLGVHWVRKVIWELCSSSIAIGAFFYFWSCITNYVCWW